MTTSQYAQELIGLVHQHVQYRKSPTTGLLLNQKNAMY